MSTNLDNQKSSTYKSYLNYVRGIYEKPIAQTSTALIMTLGTIAFFGFAAIRPTLGTVSELIKEIEDKKAIDEQITKKVSSLTAAQDEYLSATDDLTAFERAIPNELSLHHLLLILEYSAVSNKTNLSSLRVAPVRLIGDVTENLVAGDPFPSIVLGISAEGTYDELKALLHKLNVLDRYLRIESISFIQPSSASISKAIKMNANLRAYWVSDNIDLKKAPKAAKNTNSQ